MKYSLKIITLVAVILASVHYTYTFLTTTKPLVPFSQTQTAAVSDFNNALVAHYTFDDGTASDSSGNGNNGALVGGPTATTGKIGSGALSFDGVDDYVNVSETSGVPAYGTAGYSVGFWVRANVAGAESAIYAEGSGSSNNQRFHIRAVAGQRQISVNVRDDSAVNQVNASSQGTVFDDAWHHIVWTDANGAAKLYIDGQQDSQNFNYAPSALTLNRVAIGALERTSVSNYFNGSIDDVRVYNRALLANEVSELYALGSDTPPPSTTYSLSVSLTGSGTVSSNPSGISCGSACSASFNSGQSIILTASPSSGYDFTSWGGSCSGVNTTCTISSISANTSVSAIFTQQETPPAPDTTPPSTPINLTATAISSSQINLSWTASTDNVGVIGYRVYRNGSQITTTSGTSYQNTGLSANTTYSYTVSAYDAADNLSNQSSPAQATTQTVTPPPSGSTFYIRQGASGNGSDWNNAYGALPSTLQRGATYYIADGNYSGYSFSTPVSGSQYITIKKATIADHGTSVGWQTGYGDGQALFTSGWQIATGFLVIDGQTRNADWQTGYGIKIQVPSGNAIRFTGSGTLNNVTLRYMDLHGGGIVSESTVGSAVYAHRTGAIENITVEYSYTHGFWPDPFVVGGRNGHGNNFLIQYNFVDENHTSSAYHGQSIADHGASNVTVRYNKFRNPEGTAVYTVIGWDQVESGIDVYGNVIWNTPGWSGGGISAFVEVIQTATVSNMRVYNNTLYNVKWWPRIVHYWSTGSNRTAYNNVWVNSSSISTGNDNFTLDYNFFYNTPHMSEPHEQVGGNSNIFVSPSADDFRLLAPTNSGISASSPLNIDSFGNIRGADGIWDRGAYEYTGSTPPPVTCTSFTYSAWSDCVGGTQTRTMLSSSPANCTGGSPIISQNCTMPITCTSFTYSSWSACVNGSQSRTVLTSSPSGCAGGSPILTQSCSVPLSPDTTPPTVSITSPINNAAISGTVSLSANAADPTVSGQTTSGFAGLQFKLDNANIGQELTTPTAQGAYSGFWNTIGVPNGAHTLSAVARDGAGNRATSTISITINNTVIPPTCVSFTYGSWSACVNGSQSRTVLTSSPSGCAGGSPILTQSCSVPLSPDTTPPTVPANFTATAVSASQINLSWSASTDPAVAGAVTSGLANYRLYRGGTLLITVTGTSYSNTDLSPATLYDYTISAFDAAGNSSAQSAPVSTTTPALPDLPNNPPIPSRGSPLGALVAGTKETTLSLSTDKPATCKYGAVAAAAYEDLASVFTTTGSTTHSAIITDLIDNTTYTYYIRCQSEGVSTTGDYIISFSVANPAPIITPPPPPPSGGGGGGGGGGSPFGVFTPTVPQLLTPIIASTTTTITCAPKLAPSQITGILNLLRAFNAEEAIINRVNTALSCPSTQILPTQNLNGQAIFYSRIPQSFQFTKPIRVGTYSNDIKYLQIFLNDNGYIVSQKGAGSKGNETDYFGPATVKALSAFQKANGIVPAYGNFGSITLKVVNERI